MKNIIVATKNKGKYNEIKEIFQGMPFNVLSMEDIDLDFEIIEDSDTFEGNAFKKAKEVSKITGEAVIADDSGLEVEYLGGKPGIHTSRFLGENASDTERNCKLLEALKGVPIEKRRANFICAIAVVFPQGGSFTVRGICQGYIALSPKGKNGFGYDPIFYLPEYNMTTAQMESKEKNKISHRGKAIRLMIEKLKKMGIII